MPNFDFNPFLEYTQKNNIEIPNNAIESLELYGNLLLEWNEKINLTAITEPKEVVLKHFIDSLSLLKIINPKQNESLIDVGTGAGFPGMVIKILRPELNVTLLDGHAKRFIFLEDLQSKLGLSTEHFHIRAELAAKDKKEIAEIESAEFQYNMLSDFSLELQALLLEETVEDYFEPDDAKKDMDELFSLWRDLYQTR